MKALQYLIDYQGNLISPTTIQKSNIDAMHNPPTNNQVTLIFYTGIETNANGTIVPVGSVTTGLSGTIDVQARSSDDSSWSSIQDGVLNLALGENLAFPSGIIRSLNCVCTGVTGCNYILVQLWRGS